MSRRTSQAEIALWWLQRGPLCQTAMYQVPGITHRLADAIYRLRRQGYAIESRRCENPAHRHTSSVVEYVLLPSTEQRASW